jgi:peptidoglycan/LPS O-acetylase OafA/YrhL
LNPRSTRLPNLDLLRLAAAAMIVVYHFGYRGPAASGWTPSAFPEIAWLAQEMWAGVSFFFIISGFVIAWSAQKRGAMDFLVARAARLYPAFLVCMSVTAIGLALLAPAGVEEFRMTFARWLANLPLVSKAFGQPFVDGAYWSIVIEVIFYGWVAVFIALGLFERRQLTILAGWLAVALLNELVVRQQGLQYLLVTRHAGYFVLGILMFRAFAASRLPNAAEIAIGVAAIALCIIDDRAYVGWMQATLGYEPAWSPLFALSKLALMLAALVAAIRLPAMLSPALCATLGGLTYPLYLVHQNLGYALMHAMDPALGRILALGVATIVVTVIAWAVHRFVEPAGRDAVLRAGSLLRLTSRSRPPSASRAA